MRKREAKLLRLPVCLEAVEPLLALLAVLRIDAGVRDDREPPAALDNRRARQIPSLPSCWNGEDGSHRQAARPGRHANRPTATKLAITRSGSTLALARWSRKGSIAGPRGPQAVTHSTGAGCGAVTMPGARAE